MRKVDLKRENRRRFLQFLAFGQPGVERVLDLLRIELRAIMQQLGAPSIKDLKPAMVRRA
jgi:isopentenyl diphosphate isomerase/L-lactate dehydrogenase-like FMN-dependent dehydrogenase